MQAAEKKLIVERGADFRIQLEIMDGLFQKDLTNFTSGMYIQYYSEGIAIDLENGLTSDTIYNLKADGTFLEDNGTNKVEFPGILVGVTPGLNGEFNVIIDKSVTATFPTMLDMSKMTNRFGTEYNYYYHIEIDENAVGGADDDITVDRENMRVLRGKLAVRN